MHVAKATSSGLAVVLNYLCNARFNFGGNNKMKFNYLVLYGVLYAGLILFHVTVNGMLYKTSGNEEMSVLVAMAISVPINYIGVKYFFKFVRKQTHVL